MTMPFTQDRACCPQQKLSGTTMDKALVSEGSIINASRLLKIRLLVFVQELDTILQLISTYVMGSDYYETVTELALMHNMQASTAIGVLVRDCYIKNAILDKNVRIGNDVKIVGGNHLENTDT
jgi:glucose-1-phosphate adenylyltransferase